MIKVVISGMPGKTARKAAANLLRNSSFKVLDKCLSGPDKEICAMRIGSANFFFIAPKRHQALLAYLKRENENLFAADFAYPLAADKNASLYCEAGIPFVMKTSGIGWNAVRKKVEESDICAVISPNLADDDICDALMFLAEKMKQGARGRAFAMADILNG